ncbi:MAG: oligosaccharide flippase family protein [Chitinophagaceae bacterium]|nr:oligosaccharide flippase family protein [Chitinophagaceae bacterium]
MNLKKNLGYNFLLSFSQVLFPLITIPYISRVLHPSGVGQVGFIDSFTYFFTVVAEFGVVVYGIREVAKLQNDKIALGKLVSELLLIQFLTSLASFFLYLISIYAVWDKIQDYRLVMLSLSFFLSYFLYCEWFFWGTEQFRFIAIRSICIRLVAVIAVFLFIKQESDYVYYYAIIAISAILSLVLNFSRLLATIPIRFSSLNLKKHVPYLLTNYGISLLYSVFIMLDTSLLRISSTAVAAGIYLFAIKIIRISSGFVSDSLLVLYPHTVTLVQSNNHESIQTKLLQSANLVLAMSIPLSAGIFLLADDITTIYLGPEFGNVANVLRILAVYPIISTFNLFLNKQVLMANHNERSILKALAWGSVVFVVLTISLSSRFGEEGAAVALLAGEITVLCGNLYYSIKSKASVKLFSSSHIIQVLIGAAFFLPMLLLLRHWITDELVLLIVGVVSCIVVYCIWLVVIVKNSLALNLFRYVKSIASRTKHA